MAFKTAQKPTFSAKVEVNIPNDKGGFDKSTFIAKFKRLPTTELQELREKTMLNVDFVRQVLVGWEMKDEDTKEDVPFSAEALDAVLEIAPTPHATVLAFWESVNGARTKN